MATSEHRCRSPIAARAIRGTRKTFSSDACSFAGTLPGDQQASASYTRLERAVEFLRAKSRHDLRVDKFEGGIMATTDLCQWEILSRSLAGIIGSCVCPFAVAFVQRRGIYGAPVAVDDGQRPALRYYIRKSDDAGLPWTRAWVYKLKCYIQYNDDKLRKSLVERACIVYRPFPDASESPIHAIKCE